MMQSTPTVYQVRHYCWITLFVCLAMGWSILGHILIFPWNSDNSDEAVYLYQAKALVEGKFWLAQTPLSKFFMVWFQKIYNHRLIFKYTPVHASLLAASYAISGYFEPALGFIAGIAIFCTYWLARETGMTRKGAWLATLCVLLSPIFLILCTTYLGYCSFLMLATLFAALFCRAMREKSCMLLWLAGVVQGVAFFARPFDTILFTGAWLIFYPSWRSDWKETIRMYIRIAAGFIPILIIVFFFNARTTGNPFLFPFRQDDLDTFGFGLKRMFPGDEAIAYTPRIAIRSLALNIGQFCWWNLGGIFSVMMVIAYGLLVPIRKADRVCFALLIGYPAGYFFFWGIHNLVRWHKLYYWGPIYFLPCVIPFSLLAARSICLGMRAKHKTLKFGVVVAGMIAISLPLFLQAVQWNSIISDKSEKIYKFFELRQQILAMHDVVFLPQIYGSYLLHPFRGFINDVTPKGPVIYALNRGIENFDLMAVYPDRKFFRFDMYGGYNENPDGINKFQLVPLKESEGTSHPFSVSINTPANVRWIKICAVSFNRQRCLWNEHASAGKKYNMRFTARNQRIHLQRLSPAFTGSAIRHNFPLSSGDPFIIRAEFYSSVPTPRMREGTIEIYEYRFMLRAKGPYIDAIEPPEKWFFSSESKRWYISDTPLLSAR